MTGLSIDELRDVVERGEIHTVVVAFTDHYGRLMGKRVDAGFFVERVAADGTHACDYLFTVDMEMNPVTGYRFASWAQGYGDVHLRPDLGTLRTAGWTEGTAIVLCDVADHHGTPVEIAPRTILRRQVDRLAQLGFRAEAASELEFFLYDESYRAAHEQDYAALTPAGWYVEDYHLLQGARVEGYVGAARRALSASAIPVETSKGEAARGQHELNIRHADLFEMADRHTVMKHGMKELAEAMGLSVTFMAKPVAAESGSSSHLHLSLWSLGGATNVFAASGDDGESEVFGHFLAGWMRYLPDLMVCYAPTVNSYKRYADDSWAPTRDAWAHDNRTAGFRVVGHGSSLRIECRVPGADCNPYLAYAAALASGIAGIEQRLDPPAEHAGDVYRADDVPRVPSTLERANALFRESALARSAFGDDVVEHYARYHDVEVAAFHAAVTDWERRRYFERI